MLQVAKLAPQLLGESTERVERFLRAQINGDGGFRNRGGASDLYYTVFGIEGLLAIDAELPARTIASYLRRFGEGEGLDLTHLACLARAGASLPPALVAGLSRRSLIDRVETFRSADGGYAPAPESQQGTVYGCFLALGAYQDAGIEMPGRMGLLGSLDRLRSRDGGFANQPGSDVGLTAPTAAAAAIRRQLGQPGNDALQEWLLSRCHPEGGFFATPAAPIPDLLSTATALHALSALGADLRPVRETCLDFIDTLWSSDGAFYGHWADDALDCEYTYYGLLALGHLSL